MERGSTAPEEEGNQADASSQRVKLAKQEQTENSGLYFGVGVRGRGIDIECRRGRTGVCSGKAELDLTLLNLYVP